MWLDWDPVEEYDGTDAGDRDFLFGVIVHALGRAQRHEVGAAALAIADAVRYHATYVDRMQMENAHGEK
jgi:hypothetical protein